MLLCNLTLEPLSVLQGCEGGDWLLGAGGAGEAGGGLEAAGHLLLHVLLLVLLGVELETKVIRRFLEISPTRRRPLLPVERAY